MPNRYNLIGPHDPDPFGEKLRLWYPQADELFKRILIDDLMMCPGTMEYLALCVTIKAIFALFVTAVGPENARSIDDTIAGRITAEAAGARIKHDALGPPIIGLEAGMEQRAYRVGSLPLGSVLTISNSAPDSRGQRWVGVRYRQAPPDGVGLVREGSIFYSEHTSPQTRPTMIAGYGATIANDFN